jgi:hypothetical protein
MSKVDQELEGKLVSEMNEQGLDLGLRQMAAMRLIAWRLMKIEQNTDSIKGTLTLIVLLVIVIAILGGCSALGLAAI